MLTRGQRVFSCVEKFPSN